MADMDTKLTPKQEQFCQLYASDREFFGNGVQTYIEVYQPDQNKIKWYEQACISASQILRNIKVSRRIAEILELQGLNDGYVDKQLEFLITQQSELSTKLGAIREYNKLKQRITDRLDVTSGGKPLPTPIYGGQSTKPTE